MAANAVIGALRVVLGADTAAFEKGLSDAENRLGAFYGVIVKSLTAVSALARAQATSFAINIKKSLDEFDKLGKLSQSFGVPVEQLSALSHAASLSDVSLEQLGQSLGRLSKNMLEVAGGTLNRASVGFKTLGISVTDSQGRLKTTTTILEEVADRFQGMQDGATKTATAVNIFGRSGAALIPLLNQGAAGLREAREEAEALGLVIDVRTAKAAEQFNDNLKRLEQVMGATARRVAAELAPSLALLTQRVVDYAKENSTAQTTAERIIAAFEVIGRSAATVAHFVRGFTTELVALWEVARAFVTRSPQEFAEAWRRFQEEGERSAQGLEQIRITFQNFREEARMLADHMGNAGSQFGKFTPPVVAAKNAIEDFIKSQQKALASQQAEAMAVGMSAGARERLRVVMQAETIARENNLRLTAAQQIAITTLANAMQQAALQQQGMNLLLEAAPPHEKFRLEMQNNEAALRAVGATAEQVGRVMKMTAEKFGATWEQVTASAAGGFAALFNEMAKSNAEFALVAKGLAIVEATINTYVAFTKALASAPPPLNYIAAAGVLAAGLAKVAAIKSQSIPKMQSGGTLIPNAFPGRDSVLMQARVRPDERVEVLRPGEGSDDRRGLRASAATIVIQGDSFSRSHIERLVDGINDLMVDRGGSKVLQTA